jgi:hypothetical protein
VITAIVMGLALIAIVGGNRYLRNRREYAQGRKLGEKIISDLEARGVDLSAKKNIEFFLYFSSEEAARQACPELEALSYRVEIRANPDGQWLALCRIYMPGAGAGLKRSELERIAKKHGGEYDGWSVAV